MAYLEKVKKAIIASKERTGLSLPAIKKALKITDATKRFVNAALKSGVAKGVLVKNKGKYKVSAEAKKPAKKPKVSHVKRRRATLLDSVGTSASTAHDFTTLLSVARTRNQHPTPPHFR